MAGRFRDHPVAERAERGMFLPLEAEWYGKIGMTKNALPRFHQLGEQVFSWSGYNGRGIAPGTVFGLLFARHSLSELGADEFPPPLTVSHPRRFRSIRERFYEIGSQFAQLSSWERRRGKPQCSEERT